MHFVYQCLNSNIGDRMNFIKKHIRIPIYAAFLAFSVLFMLFFALWESPYFVHWYGCDASFFSMCGRGILSGWVPYIDFFDLKGPYFFFLQALSQLIFKGQLGIFITEILFFWASLILSYEILRLFLPFRRMIAVLIIFAFFHIGTLWGGNTLEEYALPLNLLVLFLTLKCLPRKESGQGFIPVSRGVSLNFDLMPSYVPFITGICFGIMAFSKITVAAPLAGIVLAVVLTNLFRKNIKAAIKYLGICLLGLIAAILPIIIYFGYHHAILKMLYCVFEFAFKRSIDYSETFNIDWELKTIGCYFAFFLAILHPKKINGTMKTLLISMSVITYVLLHLGVPFIYYFTTVYPVFILAMAVFIKLYDPMILFENVSEFVCLALLAVMLYFYAHSSIDTINTVLDRDSSTWYEDDYQAARDLAKLIPIQERNSVFSFSTDMTWFEANDILPCYKYQVNLQFFISLDPSIETDIIDYFNDTPPKWLIIGDNFEYEIPSLYKEIIMDKYTCICSNSSGNLYLLATPE